MGPVIAVENHVVFVNNNRVLEAGEVFELQDQLFGVRFENLFMAEQGRDRYDFQRQLQLFCFNEKHGH